MSVFFRESLNAVSWAKLATVSALLCLLTLQTGCATKPAGRDAWYKVLRQCAANDLLPKERLLYFGPSAKIGPGSVWAPKENGGFGLRYSLQDTSLTPAQRSNFVVRGGEGTCQGNFSSAWKFSPSATVTTVGQPLSAEITADLNRAKDVRVTVRSWRQDTLQEFGYEEWAKSDVSGTHGKDLVGPNWRARRFMDSAIAVSGFSATLNFSSSDAWALHAKYPQPTFTVGAGFTGAWVSTNTLTLTSQDEFYIAGSLSPVKGPGMLNAIAPRLVRDRISIPANVRVESDELKP